MSGGLSHAEFPDRGLGKSQYVNPEAIPGLGDLQQVDERSATSARQKRLERVDSIPSIDT